MRDNAKVWLNGNLVPWAEATVPLMSHGFARGSAVFDVFGVHKGPDGLYAFRMDEHLKRLKSSTDALEMELSQTTDEIIAAVRETVAANKIERGLVKIMVYWAEESIIQLVLDTPLDMAVFVMPENEVLKFDQMDEHISACLSKWRKIHPETVPVGAKACSNYLNGYMARRDANNRGFNVGVLLDTDGYLAEGSTEAVFIVKEGVLKISPLKRVLSSISRMSILEAAPILGIPVSIKPILPEELFEADEMFTAHTGTKVHPVSRFEDRAFQAPGPVTRQLINCFEKVLQFQDDRFSHWYQPL